MRLEACSDYRGLKQGRDSYVSRYQLWPTMETIASLRDEPFWPDSWTDAAQLPEAVSKAPPIECIELAVDPRREAGLGWI